ncbi:hypothetical protein SAMN05518672_108204 [Chitinophaga sp. CF118]|uniref:hypothetical protein n=1 Tax=Chitinophaga sp. CF118 TaxID=1884367 RepID=UPI0008DF8D35|nr:hypothetical protein [Chitinophaga sp. CF118]SFE64003.1 hypothetical protein SAMN05518672_108204 [Chitinophaga sp. CF118]
MTPIKQGKLSPNYHSFNLQLNGFPLTDEQRNHFFNCLKTISQQSEALIYRGDKIDKLSKLYNADLKSYNQNGLIFKISKAGAKGRYYTETTNDEHIGIELGMRSENPFDLIFKMMNIILTQKFSGKKEKLMNEFKIREMSVFDYFTDHQNAEHFSEQISTFDPTTRTKIRDYYLGLLHNIDRSEFYLRSFFVSTTTNLRTAEGFADARTGRANKNSLVFHGWIPREYSGVLRAPNNNMFESVIETRNVHLPRYKKLIFYNQNEIALKGAFSPNYMLGFHYWNNSAITMEINPAIFDVDGNWPGDELPINQEDFPEVFESSMYTQFLTVNEQTGEYRSYKRGDDYEWMFNKIC